MLRNVHTLSYLSWFCGTETPCPGARVAPMWSQRSGAGIGPRVCKAAAGGYAKIRGWKILTFGLRGQKGGPTESNKNF